MMLAGVTGGVGFWSRTPREPEINIFYSFKFHTNGVKGR
jgi:hypothetical protein